MQKNQFKDLQKAHLQNSADVWSRLRLFNYFRGSLSLFFITIYLNGWLIQLIPTSRFHTELFITTSIIYLISSLFFSTGIYRKKPGLDTQVIVQTLVDISCIIILMNATGGIRSGLGMLLIITISMTSLFLHKRLTILFAAISALAIIVEQIYAQYQDVNYLPAFTQAGLLGVLIFISAFITTYTSRKLKESEKLAEQAGVELENIVQMNEHIIRSMRTGIIVSKNNGEILMANNAALELLGNITIDAQQNLSQISTNLYNRFIEWINDDIQNHHPIEQSQGLPDIQPGFSHIETTTQHSNKLQGKSLIFLEDATKLNQRFQQIKLASLGRLTASIAHEIRNPLAAINHAGQLLGETSTDAADKKLTSIINAQALRLNSIVENVLQLSRQQRGMPEAIRLQHWLIHFFAEFSSTNKLQDKQLTLNINPETINILFDSNQLHQVMWNLCSNAINHTDQEFSAIRITINGAIDVDSKRPYIDICDNGAGINEETQSHIFDPFFTSSSEGTGLGLYITKEVVESNRARIRYRVADDGGACFRIYFQQT